MLRKSRPAFRSGGRCGSSDIHTALRSEQSRAFACEAQSIAPGSFVVIRRSFNLQNILWLSKLIIVKHNGICVFGLPISQDNANFISHHASVEIGDQLTKKERPASAGLSIVTTTDLRIRLQRSHVLLRLSPSLHGVPSASCQLHSSTHPLESNR